MLERLPRYRIDGEGPPLIVQGPGWGPPVDYLRATLLPLLEGRRVLTYDVRNVGSSRTEPVSSHRLQDLVEDLARVADAAGFERFELVAHSHGARIAAGFGSRFPGRIEAQVWVAPGLTGRQVAPEVPTETARRERDEALRWLARGPGAQPDDLELARWTRRAMPALFADPDRSRDFASALRRAPKPSSHAYRWVTQRHDRSLPALEALQTRSLLISGRLDPLAPPPRVAEYARRIRRAIHLVFENSGHHPWFEEPLRFRREIATFLSTAG